MDIIKNVSQDWRGLWHFIQPSILTVCCQITVVLGIALGIILKTFFTFSAVEDVYMRFPREWPTGILQLITMPYMLTGVFKRVTHAEVSIDKKTAVRVGLYFVTTTMMAVTTGLILVLVIKPGVDFPDLKTEAIFTGPALMNMIINMAPENFISATIEQPLRTYGFELHSMNTSTDVLPDEVRMGFNPLCLILIVVVYGLTMREEEIAQSTVLFVAQLHEFVNYWNDLVMRFLPLGLMSLAVSHVIEAGDYDNIIKLGKFMGVVVIGLVVQGAVIQPLVYAVMVKRNPFAVIRGVYPALLSAALTASSSSTLPVTFHCLKEKNKLNQRVTDSMSFVTSVGKDGTILYQVIAVVFVSQLSDIRLDLTSFVLIVMMTIIFSMRAPGSQEFGAITTILILTAGQLPLRDSPLLVLVEWLLERINTVVNVLTQCFSVSLAHHLLPDREEESEVQD